MANEPLLEVRDLHVSFRTEDGIVRAVDGVSFSILAGQVLGIVGESGSGKSVTAMSLMRLIRDPNAITTGEVFYKGRDLLKLSSDQMRAVRGSEIAMIFQDPMTSLNPVYRVGWQIAEQVRAHEKMSKAQAHRRAVELLDAVGIPRPDLRVDDYPHQFSGGMRQRAMIAMALSCNPDLLIADEPTTALDVTIQAQIIVASAQAAERFRLGHHADHARHGRRRRHRRPCLRHVRRPRRRGRPEARAVQRTRSTPTPGACWARSRASTGPSRTA